MTDFVDEETKNYHRALSRRFLDCPDGIARMVTLQNWSWDALDFMVERDGIDRQAVIDFCWFTAQEHPAGDADYEFAALLAYYIHLHMRRRSQAEGNFANDDCDIIQAEEGNWP